MSNNKKIEIHLSKVTHRLQPCRQLQYSIVFILARAIIENNIQLTAN
jgi:hypothetical protein